MYGFTIEISDIDDIPYRKKHGKVTEDTGQTERQTAIVKAVVLELLNTGIFKEAADEI